MSREQAKQLAELMQEGRATRPEGVMRKVGIEPELRVVDVLELG